MFEQVISFSASADKLQWPNYFPKEPPSIYNWLCRLLMGQDVLPFPYLAKVSQKTKNIIAVSTLKKFLIDLEHSNCYTVMFTFSSLLQLYVALLENETNLEEAVWMKYLRKISGSGQH